MQLCRRIVGPGSACDVFVSLTITLTILNRVLSFLGLIVFFALKLSRKLFDKALVCFFDKTWWNEAHQNTFSLSSLFYYSKYNRDHFEGEISQ